MTTESVKTICEKTYRENKTPRHFGEQAIVISVLPVSRNSEIPLSILSSPANVPSA